MDEQAPSGTVISSSAPDLLLAHIDRFGAYHTQKETMTWSAATLYVVAVSVVKSLFVCRSDLRSQGVGAPHGGFTRPRLSLARA